MTGQDPTPLTENPVKWKEVVMITQQDDSAKPLICAHWMMDMKFTNRWAQEFTQQGRHLISEVIELTCECGEVFLYHGTREPVRA